MKSLHTPSSTTIPLARAAATASARYGSKPARSAAGRARNSSARSLVPITIAASRVRVAMSAMACNSAIARHVSIITHNSVAAGAAAGSA